MKKTLLTFSFIVLSIAGFAQTLSFGVRGGLNWAYQELFNGAPSSDYHTSPITSFSIGGFADIRKGDFSLQPGIFLNEQGSDTKYPYIPPVSNPSSYNTSETKTKLWYAEIPIDFVYHLPIPFNDIYIGAGPYIAIGISGKTTDIESTIYPTNPAQNTRTTYTQNASFDPYDYERAFLGGNVMAGIKLKNGLLLDLGFNRALIGINRTDPGYMGMKDNEFMIAVGYGFK